MDMDTHGPMDPPHRRADTRAKQLGRMRDDISTNEGEIVEDAQVDPGLTRSLVASTLHYSEETYLDWEDTIRGVSIGVILMVQTLDVNTQGQIRFAHLAQGGKFTRDRA